MKELIATKETESGLLCEARDLHDFLGYDKSQWARWYKRNIVENTFAIEGVDYWGFDQVSNGNTTKEFSITLDFAKKLSMLARNEKGEEARNYFLECEKKAKGQVVIPKSPTEIILFAAQQLHEQSLRMDNIEEKVRVIEASKETNDGGYVAIMGYARIVNKPIDVGTADKLGIKAKSMCKNLGFDIKTVPDQRYGKVNVYPKDVLEVVFNEYFEVK